MLPQGVEGTSQLVPIKEERDTAGPGSKAIPGQAPPCLWGQRALPGTGAYCGRLPLADAALHLMSLGWNLYQETEMLPCLRTSYGRAHLLGLSGSLISLDGGGSQARRKGEHFSLPCFVGRVPDPSLLVFGGRGRIPALSGEGMLLWSFSELPDKKAVSCSSHGSGVERRKTQPYCLVLPLFSLSVFLFLFFRALFSCLLH